MTCARCAAFPKRSVHHERDFETSLPFTVFVLPTSGNRTRGVAYSNTILPSIEADISSMSAKIAALQATLHSMEQERDALEAVHKQYRNLIHPRRAVPPELWSEIFLFAALRVDEDFDACDSSGPIWALSQVCRPWRDIALSLHSLCPILELVLQRTGQCPLEVTLANADYHNRIRRSSDVHPLSLLRDRVLGMIFAESHRWRTLQVLEYEHSDTLYAPLCDRLPQLESLSLWFSYEPTLVAEAQPAHHAFRDCPHLFIEDDTGLPLFHEDCLAYIRLVGQCTSIEKLRLPLHPLIPPLIHSNLHKLTTGCGHLIDRLTLPHLEEAVLSKDLDSEYANFLPSFDRLLRRSHCTSLTKLDVIDLTLADHLLISILSQTPSLTALHLRASMADDNDEPNTQAMREATELIQALQVTPQQTVTFLPRVSSVKICLTEHMDSSGFPYFRPRSSFSSMVKARWVGDTERGLAKLQTFHFSLSAGLLESPYHDTTGRLPRLRNEVEARILSGLVNDGMDLVVRVTAILEPRGLDSTDILTVG
ncbi:hypothetical protein BDZ89DRAFT_1063678 [Hymenopellis radicata]|nr:hypothetical protein BDZ89DRAFT_1063678 [Hymenopellis radicata]